MLTGLSVLSNADDSGCSVLGHKS